MTANHVTTGTRRHRVFWTLQEADHRPALRAATLVSAASALAATQLSHWQQALALLVALHFGIKAALMAKHQAGSWAFAFLWVGNHLPRFDAVAPIRHVAWAHQGWAFLSAGLLGLGLTLQLQGTAQLVALLTSIILMWHLGLTTLLATAWWQIGHDVTPLCQNPWLMSSVSDFWAQRWNRAWRDAAFSLILLPLGRKLRHQPRWVRRTLPLTAVLLIAAVVAEVLISLPFGLPIGGPTAYCALQGLGLALDRTTLPFHRLRAWLIVVGGLPLLFS
jgi:hypothetical protein